MLGCCPVRISHPKVNNVFTSLSGFNFQGIDNAENIRGESLNPVEFKQTFIFLPL
jgi:hypothetical protein